MHQNPWARIGDQTADGKARGNREAKWHHWDIEYSYDLYSLTGNIHQTSKVFDSKNRGKQTLCNFVVAVAMTNIYELSEWSAAILDSILLHGDHYFSTCVKNIAEDNHELGMEDLLESCSVFPYTFKVAYSSVVNGTTFMADVRRFNLYKALRFFFDGYDNRSGVVIAQKGNVKRLLAFGKTKESEYFVYDCEAMGLPMFSQRQGVSYVLRCTTLVRLLYCLILTLRGGDFFIYEVETYDFNPIN